MSQSSTAALIGNFVDQLEIQPRMINAWLEKHEIDDTCSTNVKERQSKRTMICMAQWG